MRRVRVVTSAEHPQGRVETEDGTLVDGVESVAVNLRVGELPRINLSFTGRMVDSDVLGILDEPDAQRIRHALHQHFQHLTARTLQDAEDALGKVAGPEGQGMRKAVDAFREAFRLQGMIR